jgi:hypothetical protein
LIGVVGFSCFHVWQSLIQAISIRILAQHQNCHMIYQLKISSII